MFFPKPSLLSQEPLGHRAASVSSSNTGPSSSEALRLESLRASQFLNIGGKPQYSCGAASKASPWRERRGERDAKFPSPGRGERKMLGQGVLSPLRGYYLFHQHPRLAPWATSYRHSVAWKPRNTGERQPNSVLSRGLLFMNQSSHLELHEAPQPLRISLRNLSQQVWR